MWATRYRPNTFDELIGQETVIKVIRGALALKGQHSFPRSWLFHGPQGLGKTSLARLLASTLLECSVDHLKDNPNYFEHNASTCSSVEVLDGILSSVEKSPWDNARYRVYVLDEAHDLSSTAKDRLLTVLEEFRGQVVFILLTTDINKLKPTLRSRCLTLALHRVPYDQLMSRLQSIAEQEGLEVDARALSLLVHRSNGYVREALMMLQQVGLAGPVTVDSVNQYLGLDVQQAAVQLLSSIPTHWDRIPNLVNKIADLYAPSVIWRFILDLLVDSYVTKSFPDVGQEVHRQIVGWFGDDLSPLGEWCLTYGSKFTVNSVSDLLAGIAYLKHRLRATSLAKSMTTNSRKTVSRRDFRKRCLRDTDIASEQEIKDVLLGLEGSEESDTQ